MNYSFLPLFLIDQLLSLFPSIHMVFCLVNGPLSLSLNSVSSKWVGAFARSFGVPYQPNLSSIWNIKITAPTKILRARLQTTPNSMPSALSWSLAPATLPNQPAKPRTFRTTFQRPKLDFILFFCLHFRDAREMADLAFLIYSFLCVLAITLLYQVIAGAIYRLYYSPISHIPGPKIAALTFWQVQYPLII